MTFETILRMIREGFIPLSHGVVLIAALDSSREAVPADTGATECQP